MSDFSDRYYLLRDARAKELAFHRDVIKPHIENLNRLNGEYHRIFYEMLDGFAIQCLVDDEYSKIFYSIAYDIFMRGENIMGDLNSIIQEFSLISFDGNDYCYDSMDDDAHIFTLLIDCTLVGVTDDEIISNIQVIEAMREGVESFVPAPIHRLLLPRDPMFYYTVSYFDGGWNVVEHSLRSGDDRILLKSVVMDSFVFWSLVFRDEF